MSLAENIVPQSIVDLYKHYKNLYKADEVRRRWEKAGKPLPPPHIIKQQAIRYYQHKSGYQVLVETGTYKGDMILAQLDTFATIYSIELSPGLYERAKNRFRKHPSVRLRQGNSGEVIAEVLAELQEPAIFWLDGHYSGGITARIEKYSPIEEELKTLIHHRDTEPIILIDDARGFVGEHGYPTLDEMRMTTEKFFPGYHFSVDEDIIRMVPGKFA